MSSVRSFAEYVKDKFYNELYKAATDYVTENWNTLDLYSRKVRYIGRAELSEATIQRVYIKDLPGTRISFEVGLELEVIVGENDYNLDNYDLCNPWIRIYCEGDLAVGLEDWKIKHIEPYSRKSISPNSLSDSLVPIIPYDQLDKAATDFLRNNYPDALEITPYGQPPISVDPLAVAKKLNLTIMQHRIREDASLFGQIFFEETDTEMYDENLKENRKIHIKADTIIVDPQMYLLRNLGSVNNTIIHECVHYAKHRKVFMLEKMYNSEASNISCEVVGGAYSPISNNAVEMMEKQANQLTPRIQMPAEPFKAKAREYIVMFMRQNKANHPNEIMEQVITALETGFCVSRLAAKIRLVELGFEEAIGTYTYLDGHYVKSHSFSKGAIKIDQTFSISSFDAAIQRRLNPKLRKLTEDGDYLFVDNHFVYNSPLYIKHDENGRLDPDRLCQITYG